MANEYRKMISDKKKEAGALMTSKQLKHCNIAIHTATVAACAGGAVPIPVIDAIPISAAQVTMVIALGKIFDQKISESAAKGLVSAAASTIVGRSLVKLIPLAGLFASAAVAAGITEAIGWSIAVDLAKKSKLLETSDLLEQDIRESLKNANTADFDDDLNDVEAMGGDNTTAKTEDPDDESIAYDFSKAFGEEDE